MNRVFSRRPAAVVVPVLALLLALGGLASAPAAAETVMPVKVGDARLHVGVDDDQLRISQTLPSLHGSMGASLPPTSRLVEGFISQTDAKRVLLGLPWQGTLLVVQSLRSAEPLVFSAAEWEEGRPQLVKTLRGMDLNAAMARMAEADRRGGAKVREKSTVEFGDLGKLQVYDDSGPSVRFVVLLPMTVQVDGEARQVTLEAAGAVARLAGKVVYLYAYRHHAEGNSTQQVRAALDRFADRAIALNPDEPTVASTRGRDVASAAR